MRPTAVLVFMGIRGSQAYANAGEAEKAKDFYDSMVSRDLKPSPDDRATVIIGAEHGLTAYIYIYIYTAYQNTSGYMI